MSVPHRVVVTGLGAVTPLGADVEQIWKRLLAGEVGVRTPVRNDAGACPTRAVGEVAPDVLAQLRSRHPELADADARTLFGVRAALDAYAHAGGPTAAGGAVILGAGPGMHRLEDHLRMYAGSETRDTPEARRPDRIHSESLVRNAAERPAAHVARTLGLTGPVHAVITACSAGNQAVGAAFRMVQEGEAPFAIAGGADSQVNPIGLIFFQLLGAAASHDQDARTACRPFDRRRSGMVMGEGAGVVVLEREDHARARGATILAELVGYGSSMDAWRTTAPCPDGRGAAEAIRAALEDARADAAEVGFINAHGTATKRNDPAEVAAIRTVLGGHADNVAVSAGKGAFGHLLSGAAGVALVTSVLAVRDQRVPPTANYEHPDPQCDLDFVPGVGRDHEVEVALNQAFAFGGQNAVLALRRYHASPSEGAA